MPKLGTRTRIIAAALAAAALAVVAAGSATAAPAKHNGTTLIGAGSSFVAPLVSQWIPAVGTAFGYELQYSPIGSGGGISAIQARTVDFGASDAPLTPDQFTACKGCVQIPWALSATSIIYNLDGVKNNLKIDGPTLANIFLGNIKTWNDPAIAKQNKGVTLPSTPIATVHRSDNSGTTYNFSDYLSTVSPAWKSGLGVGVAVNWPSGTGARGSAGVAAAVGQTPGGIGYVDIAYAKTNHLKFMSVKNRSGKYTLPGLRGILAAATSDQKPDATNALSIVNPPKKFDLAYPISTYTYVIVPEQSTKAADMKKFLFWAVTKGQTFGPKLLFVPIPKNVLVVAEKTITKIHS